MRRFLLIIMLLTVACNRYSDGYIKPKKKMPGVMNKPMHRPNVNRNRHPGTSNIK